MQLPFQSPLDGVLLVTGASRGIGAACARLGAQAGYRVVVNYARSQAAAQALVDEIAAAGGRAMAVQADVSDPAQVSHLFETTDRSFGPVSALINNAGIGGTIAPLLAHTPETMAQIFATNTMATLYCAQAAAKRMCHHLGGSGGVIVNISSAAARLGGMPGMVVYAASKGAVDSLTIGLAKELGGDGVRVLGLRPGVIDTDILTPMGGAALMAQLAPTIPLGRVGRAEEIAQAAIWLLSPAASYLHGTTLDVSGGR